MAIGRFSCFARAVAGTCKNSITPLSINIFLEPRWQAPVKGESTNAQMQSAGGIQTDKSLIQLYRILTCPSAETEARMLRTGCQSMSTTPCLGPAHVQLTELTELPAVQHCISPGAGPDKGAGFTHREHSMHGAFVRCEVCYCLFILMVIFGQVPGPNPSVCACHCPPCLLSQLPQLIAL